MPTLTVPLSRIEGHARASIEFRGDQVLAAHFEATEKRGFELFCQGAPAEQMPVIVPRICGVCSTAHHIAAVKALEAAFGVEPPPKAITIRGLMMLGQLIQNQATSLFLFTMPDFPGREGLPSLFHFDMQDAGLAARALEVRRLGTDLITLAGGQFIHPVKAAVGGVTSGIPRQQADELRRRFQEHLPLAEELFSRYRELLMGLRERIGTLGDDTPTHYIGAVEPRHTYYGSTIRIMAPDGTEAEAFEPCDYAQYLTEVPLESSYSNGTLYAGQVLNCNSLARANMLSTMGTPKADAYLKRFHREWGHPAHAILLFDLARGIELIYGIERAIEILEQDLDGGSGAEGDLRVGYTPQDGEGCGLVEAPRGPLIHHYGISGGVIRRARFIIPTQHNILAIERALYVAAERYISEQGISLELERAMGRVVRAFDPCIACATH
jgi:F420-non-reducing hydrogenase large subunit